MTHQDSKRRLQVRRHFQVLLGAIGTSGAVGCQVGTASQRQPVTVVEVPSGSRSRANGVVQESATPKNAATKTGNSSDTASSGTEPRPAVVGKSGTKAEAKDSSPAQPMPGPSGSRSASGSGAASNKPATDEPSSKDKRPKSDRASDRAREVRAVQHEEKPPPQAQKAKVSDEDKGKPEPADEPAKKRKKAKPKRKRKPAPKETKAAPPEPPKKEVAKKTKEAPKKAKQPGKKGAGVGATEACGIGTCV